MVLTMWLYAKQVQPHFPLLQMGGACSPAPPSWPLCCFGRLWFKKKAHDSKINENVQAEGSLNPHREKLRVPQRRGSPEKPTPQWGSPVRLLNWPLSFVVWNFNFIVWSFPWDSGGLLEFSPSIYLLNLGTTERPAAQKGVVHKRVVSGPVKLGSKLLEMQILWPTLDPPNQRL